MGTQARTTSRGQRLAAIAVERRRTKRNRTLGAAGGAIIIALLIAVVVAEINAATGGDAATDTADAPTALRPPAGATATGAIPIGTPTHP